MTVTKCGRICFSQQRINFSVVVAGQSVGVNQVYEAIWMVSFMYFDLGFFDLDNCKINPASNSFSAKAASMWSE